jgi:uncharacterized coiled-coil protein SlyX
MKQYIKPFLTTFSVALFLYTMYTQNEKITELKTTVVKQEKLVDSLRDDLFQSQNANGRYELTLDYLKENNAKCYEQVKNFYETETE